MRLISKRDNGVLLNGDSTDNPLRRSTASAELQYRLRTGFLQGNSNSFNYSINKDANGVITLSFRR